MAAKKKAGKKPNSFQARLADVGRHGAMTYAGYAELWNQMGEAFKAAGISSKESPLILWIEQGLSYAILRGWTAIDMPPHLLYMSGPLLRRAERDVAAVKAIGEVLKAKPFEFRFNFSHTELRHDGHACSLTLVISWGPDEAPKEAEKKP